MNTPSRQTVSDTPDGIRPVRRRGAVFRTFVVLSSLALAGGLAACGEQGSSGTKAPNAQATGEGCAPVAGKELVVLTDDKKLQTADNVVPAINAKKSSPELIAAVDSVSAALDTSKLIALNKAVGIERQTPEAAAQAFAKEAGLGQGLQKGSGTITIGVADFPESKTLGALYAYVLDAAGFKTSVRTIGNRELYEPALERGEIDMVPEYLGTLTEFLNQKQNGKDAEPLASSDVDKTHQALTDLGKEAGLAFGKPSEAADQNAFAVTKAFADKYQVKTLSEFGEKCGGQATVLGGPPECPERPFCQPGLKETYNIEAGSFKSLDAGGKLTKDALRNGDVTIGLVFSSDAELTA